MFRTQQFRKFDLHVFVPPPPPVILPLSMNEIHKFPPKLLLENKTQQKNHQKSMTDRPVLSVVQVLEQFRDLVPYFTGVSIGSILNKESWKNDFVKDSNIEHRFRMRQFVESVVGPAIDKVLKQDPRSVSQTELNNHLYLNLNDKLLSVKFKSIESQKMFVDQLYSYSVDPRVQYISMRRNFLQDEDMEHILKFVSKACENRINLRLTIDLENNYFHGYHPSTRESFDENLKKILSLPQVTNVNLCNNPFASVDRSDFFSEVEMDQLKKLIWIPSQWLDNQLWTSMVRRSEAEIKVIFEAHLQFYTLTDKSWLIGYV